MFIIVTYSDKILIFLSVYTLANASKGMDFYNGFSRLCSGLLFILLMFIFNPSCLYGILTQLRVFIQGSLFRDKAVDLQRKHCS